MSSETFHFNPQIKPGFFLFNNQKRVVNFVNSLSGIEQIEEFGWKIPKEHEECLNTFLEDLAENDDDTELSGESDVLDEENDSIAKPVTNLKRKTHRSNSFNASDESDCD